MSEEEKTSTDQPPAEEESQEAKEDTGTESEQDWGDDVSEDKDGGLLKKILTPGQGTAHPMNGDEVSVHYTGRLLNGEVFDSSVERGEYFKFKLGEGQVIKGWEQGVATMTRGEKCILTCKPDYAYGENGSPPKIPPNATLRFEVELFDWSGEDITGTYAWTCTLTQTMYAICSRVNTCNLLHLQYRVFCIGPRPPPQMAVFPLPSICIVLFILVQCLRCTYKILQH